VLTGFNDDDLSSTILVRVSADLKEAFGSIPCGNIIEIL
jgi:hypothetical protein